MLIAGVIGGDHNIDLLITSKMNQPTKTAVPSALDNAVSTVQINHMPLVAAAENLHDARAIVRVTENGSSKNAVIGAHLARTKSDGIDHRRTIINGDTGACRCCGTG